MALLIVALVACKGDKQPAPAPASGAAVGSGAVGSGAVGSAVGSGAGSAAAPTAEHFLVEGIRGLCAASELNVADAAMAMRDWTAKMIEAKEKDFAMVYLAALDGDDAALGRLKAAAEVAAGPGKCSILDDVVKRSRERNAEIAAMPAPGPASKALVADMKHFCKGPEGLADMNPTSFRELNVLIAKGEYEKARDAVKQAKLKACAPLEELIAGASARKGSAK